MPFVKLIKNKAYYKRYQVKYRRRREGKTDYYARQRLTAQDKNKYLTPKYRLVVRFTNRFVLAQIIRAEIDGDKCICQASSAELPRYGLKVGLKNYAAAYCTGLLVARRVLSQLGLADKYEGNTEIDAQVTSTTDMNDAGVEKKYWVASMDEERRPFRCYLDVGLRRTTTGARVFGALKGAADGGLDIPHNERRFPGYDRDAKEYDADFHRDRIFGKHVGDYMQKLSEESPEKFQKHFGKFIEAGVDADKLEDLYSAVHANIRKDPAAKKTRGNYKPDKKYKKKGKDTYEERKQRVQAKKLARLQELQAEMGADMEDDE